MEQGLRDSIFFERWLYHRRKYFTILALAIIVLVMISIALYLFWSLNFIQVDSFVIILLLASIGVLTILTSIYLVIAKPPIKSE